MGDAAFESAVQLLVDNAPANWLQLQARYQYYDGAMKIKTYYRDLVSDSWQAFNYGSFELMDFFDAYRVMTHESLDEPWSAVTLTVDKDKQYNVEFGYGDPGVLNV